MIDLFVGNIFTGKVLAPTTHFNVSRFVHVLYDLLAKTEFPDDELALGEREGALAQRLVHQLLAFDNAMKSLAEANGERIRLPFQQAVA